MTSVRLTGNDGAVQIPVRVLPRARRDAIDGERNGAVCVRLKAPPVEGAANRALVRFMAGELGVPASSVSVVSGDRSRDKMLRVTGATLGEVAARLAAKGVATE